MCINNEVTKNCCLNEAYDIFATSLYMNYEVKIEWCFKN